MASLNLMTGTLSYTKADEDALLKVKGFAANVANYDAAAKQDATTASVALGHLLEHVRRQRNGKPTSKE